jgi:hypothetical protein
MNIRAKQKRRPIRIKVLVNYFYDKTRYVATTKPMSFGMRQKLEYKWVNI